MGAVSILSRATVLQLGSVGSATGFKLIKAADLAVFDHRECSTHFVLSKWAGNASRFAI